MAAVPKVRDIMTDRIVSIEPEATVSETLSRMGQHQVHEMPILSDGTLKGWVSYRAILRRGGIPPQAKLGTIVDQPPRLNKDADVFDAANTFITNNVRAAPVVDGKGKLVGILSRTDVLRAALDMPAVADVSVESAMNRDLETAPESEPVEHAIGRLRELALWQLLVLDANGKFLGVARWDELLKARLAVRAPEGTPRSDRVGERRPAKLELKGFVRPAPSVPPTATLRDVIQAMQRSGDNCVVVVRDGFAVGVVSRSNVVERVAHLRPSKDALCQITGLAGVADVGTFDTIYGLAQHSLQKIALETPPDFLSLHYKIYKAKAEGDSKFALSVHLGTRGRFFVQKAEAWDPVDATRQAFDNLEKRILNVKELRLERRKGGSARTAEFYTATQA